MVSETKTEEKIEEERRTKREKEKINIGVRDKETEK
jgi:hypothetical protein